MELCFAAKPHFNRFYKLAVVNTYRATPHCAPRNARNTHWRQWATNSGVGI
jgi:hypothetical protein